MGLDPRLAEGLGKGPDSLVGVFTGEQLDLLKGASIRLHSGEAAHINDRRGDPLQLVGEGLVLPRALEHVSVDETELYRFPFLYHKKRWSYYSLRAARSLRCDRSPWMRLTCAKQSSPRIRSIM